MIRYQKYSLLKIVVQKIYQKFHNKKILIIQKKL